MQVTNRSFLATFAVVGMLVVAGCAGPGGGNNGTDSLNETNTNPIGMGPSTTGSNQPMDETTEENGGGSESGQSMNETSEMGGGTGTNTTAGTGTNTTAGTGTNATA